MNRRNALKNLGLSFGAIAVTPSIIGMMQSCTSSSSGFRPKVFSKTQFKHVEKILNLILPKTEDGIPGASVLGLAEFVDNYLHGVVGDKQVSLLRLSLDSFIQDINESDDEPNQNSVSSSEFTTADYNGTQIKYDISIPYSIPSQKTPIFIEIQQLNLKATYNYYCLKSSIF